MSSWNAAIVFLVVLLYSPQVYSDTPTITSKTIDTTQWRLIIGTNHYDESNFLYGLCENYGLTAYCKVFLQSEIFDKTYTCKVRASSQLGKVHLLAVELWGSDKILFLWRDVNTNNERQGELYVEIMQMENCFSRAINHFPINIRPDNFRQEYVITSQFHYHLSFINEGQCVNHMCNVTVDINGNANPIQPWFLGTDLICTLESIEYSSKNLLISFTENAQIAVEVYLINGNTKQFLTSFGYFRIMRWSSSNGIILFCYRRTCKRYNFAGQLVSEKVLSEQQVANMPTKYLAIYNMPDEGLLAVVCSREENSVYRIIQIQDGRLVFTYDLKNLGCSQYFLQITGKLYEKSSGEYCLSVFFAENTRTAEFVSYCFFLSNI